MPLSAIVKQSSEGLQTVKNFLDSSKTRLSSPCTSDGPGSTWHHEKIPMLLMKMQSLLFCLQALQEGYQLGQGEGQQVPLSAIVNHSSEGLQTVKNFLDSGKTRLSSSCSSKRPRLQLQPQIGNTDSPPKSLIISAAPMLRSPFHSIIDDFGKDSDFDSGAETDWEIGSQVTEIGESEADE